MERREILQRLREQPDVDVLIIGGGINGIGTFRDLALQGVRVLLVERGDFCSGASAGSSHMLHGGIRYLENGEFRLVREALTERNLLLQNAPHYAKPLPTTIPIFSWLSGMFNAPLKFLRLRDKPGERGALVIKIGLIFYDIFARAYRVMPTHKVHLRGKSLQDYPQLNPDIVCTATYYDAWMPTPERLCIELVLDAEATTPDAQALSYTSAAGGAGSAVTLRDELSGETFSVRPKVVINAAGPWIDFVNRAMQQETRFIGGTKGSHLILENKALHDATNGHEIFFENNDGRIVLIFPYMGKVMVGTTDIRVEHPDEAVTTDDEVAYILDMIGRVFPNIPVDRSQIIFTFCGVRPLPASDKSYTGNVSRDHSVRVVQPGFGLDFPVLSLVGGKWTTFRAFSELTTDRALGLLGKPRQASTKHLPVGGGRDYPRLPQEQAQWVELLAQRTAISTARAQQLFERYGTRASDVAHYLQEGADAPLRHLPEYSRREILFMVEHEKALTLDDIVLRRSLIAWLGQLNADAFAELADVLAQALGWDASQKQAQMQNSAAVLRREHRLELTLNPAPQA